MHWKTETYKPLQNEDSSKTFVKILIRTLALLTTSVPDQSHCKYAAALSGICCHLLRTLLLLKHVYKTGEKFLN